MRELRVQLRAAWGRNGGVEGGYCWLRRSLNQPTPYALRLKIGKENIRDK